MVGWWGTIKMQYLGRFIGGREEEENLMEVTAEKSHRIVRNRLLLTSLANLLTFLLLIFSMSYYNWGRIQMPFYVLDQQESDLVVRGYLSLYINLLYGKQPELSYYQSYPNLARAVCLSNDIFCHSVFEELQCIGILCSLLMGLGAAFQLYDIVAMASHFCRQGKVEVIDQGDNMQHWIVIGHYFVGVTLNIFGLQLMEVQVFLGVSFWVFVGGVVIFIGVIVAQEIALNQLKKQNMILSLLRGGKKASNHLNGPTIELSEESQGYYL